MKQQKRNTHSIAKEVTNQIIEAIKNNQLGEWTKPWVTYGPIRNLVSDRPYQGALNRLLLGITSLAKGFELPLWITYNQTKSLGGRIKQGEKAQRIIFYKFIEKKTDTDEQEEKQMIPIIQCHNVFNIWQTDLPWAHLVEDLLREKKTKGECLKKVERFIGNIPHELRTGGDRCFYDPKGDYIQLVETKRFKNYESRYSCHLHELSHWTSAESRLHRSLNDARFGNEAYAFEELVAELSSAYACADLGIKGQLQHSEYINSWLSVLEADEFAIFTASRLAQEAFEYLLSFQNENDVA